MAVALARKLPVVLWEVSGRCYSSWPSLAPPPPRPRHPPHLLHLPPPHGIERGRVALLRAAALPRRSGLPPPRRDGPPPPPRVALLRCGEEEAGVRGSGPRRRSPWLARRAGPRAAAQPWRAEPAPAWRPASPPPRASPARQGGVGSAAGKERGREREGKGRSGGRGREGKRSDEGREREEMRYFYWCTVIWVVRWRR